ncbi:uncharacterized protein LOC122289250 [Carya illinoinensis]|uniref:uncharacterized protein LOC122289250 n=1 Tax=Carya illinoinensis TaxID=32201 RepID=UPI001C719B45|nr:uncharacterized protein LOC122289250 [Carya illinoinensis]
MEDLESIWKRLSLNEEENEAISVRIGGSMKLKKRGECSLIGKVCSNRTKGKDVVSATMSKIWKVSRPPVFTEIRTNVFIVTFATEGDKRRVLEGRPWLFDNLMFALKPFDGMTQPSKINFDLVSLWVHMHNLPLSYMEYSVGKEIGESIGKVEEVDAPKDDVGWGSYLRVKVEMDMRKAVARGRTIEVEGKKLWVPFTYEKLPKLCFKCGCIIHGEEGCTGGILSQAIEGERKTQFGPWLRASGGPRGNFKGWKGNTENEGGREEKKEKEVEKERSGEEGVEVKKDSVLREESGKIIMNEVGVIVEGNEGKDERNREEMNALGGAQMISEDEGRVNILERERRWKRRAKGKQKEEGIEGDQSVKKKREGGEVQEPEAKRVKKGEELVETDTHNVEVVAVKQPHLLQ